MAVTTIVGFVIFAAGCSQERRSGEVQEVIDAAWEAVGADPDVIYLDRYVDTTVRGVRDCSHLDEDDRWYGEQSSSLPPDVIDQADVQQGLVRFLEDEGFSVDLYRRPHRDTGLRALWATKGEMVAFGHISVDGGTSFHVRSGPCAPFIGGFEGSDRYERIDD